MFARCGYRPLLYVSINKGLPFVKYEPDGQPFPPQSKILEGYEPLRRIKSGDYRADYRKFNDVVRYDILAGMNTVTITKTQYEALKKQATAYQRIVSAAHSDLFGPPPTHDVRKVIADFRKTKRYSKEFLNSLGKGLSRSSHFRK